MRARSALVFLFLALQLPAQQQAGKPADEQAWLLLIGGRRAGIQHQRIWALPDGLHRTEESLRLAVSRFSQPFMILQRIAWIEGGRLRSVEAEIELNGQRESLSAWLEGDRMQVVQERHGGRSAGSLLAEGEVLGPWEATVRIREALARSRPELALLRFQPQTASLETVHCAFLGPAELRDSLGGLHRGELIEERSSAFPGLVTRSILDGRGQVLYAVTEAGLKMEQVRLEAAQADGEVSGGPESGWRAETGELELFDVAFLAIPVRWLAGSPPSLSRLSAVRVRFMGRAVPELERAVRAALADLGGRGFRLEESGEGLTVLMERIEEPPAAAAARLPGGLDSPGGPATAQFTGDGFYLDLSDPRLAELFARCPAGDPACLEALVFSFIRTKSLAYGFSGVAEILASASGDCTEHALLLAALLRKAGFASRIAYGFLLTEAGFVGHAWTEVFAGECWHWLDPSFPGGRPYRFHLRLGVLDPALPVWQQMGPSLLSAAAAVRAVLLEAFDER